MVWIVYEFLDSRGRGIIEVWLRQARIQERARARLNQKLDLLEQVGPDLPPGLLAGPVDSHIYKLRIKAPGVQLRPLLCRGPIHNDREFTLLCGATERDYELVPSDAVQQAERNREIVLPNHERRRRHEHHF
jgi:hypothetical protein